MTITSLAPPPRHEVSAMNHGAMSGGALDEATAEIEFIDEGTLGSPKTVADHVSSSPGANRVGAAIAIAIAVVAGFVVFGTGDNEPRATPPDTTARETNESATSEPKLTEQEQAEADFGVAIGDGPGLAWHPVGSSANSEWARWSSGGFVIDNGSVEQTIRLVDEVVTVTETASPQLAHPGYQVQTVGDAQLIVPSEPLPDHFVLLRDDHEPARFDIPPLTDLPEGDLIETNVWVYGAIVGDRLVLNISTSASVDLDAIEARTGRNLDGAAGAWADFDHLELYGPGSDTFEPINFVDEGFTEAEITQLKLTNNHSSSLASFDLITRTTELDPLPDLEFLFDLTSRADGRLLVGWIDDNRTEHVSSTTDGIDWTTESTTNSRSFEDSGTHPYNHNGPGLFLERSGDGGSTWQSTRVPLPDTPRAVADDVIVLGRPWNGIAPGEAVAVETGSERHQLLLFEDFQRFELHDTWPFGEPLLTGWVHDARGPATWEHPTNELVFTNPDTGTEILRLPGHAITAAFAAQNPMKHMAITRWPADTVDPEWLVTSPQEVFGDAALSVNFIAGGHQILAVVTTAEGFDLFITDVSAQP